MIELRIDGLTGHTTLSVQAYTKVFMGRDPIPHHEGTDRETLIGPLLLREAQRLHLLTTEELQRLHIESLK